MRIGELSRRSGVSVTTLKWWIREGLLSPGVTTAANQAEYGDAHLARVALIRALREVAGLPVATIRATLEAMASGDGSADHVAVALGSLSTPREPPAEGDGEATARVERLLAGLGWRSRPDDAARDDLVRAVAAVERWFPGGVSDDALAGYGQTAQALAERELPQGWNRERAVEEALRYAVLGTVLFEPLLLALRRLAHAERHARLREERAGSPG